MGVTVVRLRSIHSLVNRLTEMALPGYASEFVFRGHSDSRWRIASTFARYSTSALVEYRGLAFQHLINQFHLNLSRLGDHRMDGMPLRAKLEFARHSGVPSPLIDFTRSPLIALWFAFNGVRGSTRPKESVAIYALDLQLLGGRFAFHCEKSGTSGRFRRVYSRPVYDVCRWERRDFFDGGYPLDILKFVPNPASWNRRMQRQMGCFIYDNMLYQRTGLADFEEFVEFKDRPEGGSSSPIMTKFIVPCHLARDAFDYLDLNGITGVQLFDDPSGAAADTYNSYNHSPRVGAWDISPED